MFISTNVTRISIEFDVKDMNMILRTRNCGLHLYTSRHKIDYPWYSVVGAVKK